MVEGPQCNLKAQKLRQAIVGQRMRRVQLAAALQGSGGPATGAAPSAQLSGGPAATTARSSSVPERLAAAGPVVRVTSVGKECFVVFAECVLRLHFGMSGSERIRTGAAAPLQPGSRKKLTMTLEFERCCVDLFDCSAPSLRTFGYLAEVEARAGRDVVARDFDRAGVIEHLRADPRSAYDALMDQVSFPGVGNVIKCEGLHEAAISPTLVLSELPATRLALLVDATRAFAQCWHDSCRRGVGIAKRVYGKTACACGEPISLVRAGEKNRITYFCRTCQSQQASLMAHIPRRGSSLLGWVHHGQRAVASAGTSRPSPGLGIVDLEHAEVLEHANGQLLATPWLGTPRAAATSTTNSCWRCTSCTTVNSGNDLTCGACRGSKPGTKSTAPGGASSGGVAAGVGGGIHGKSGDGDRRGAKRPSSAIAVETSASAVSGGAPLIAPSCTCGLLGKLQRVRKEGPNHGRLFWSCAKRQGCGAFIWADADFPMCKCQKRSTMRRVLKEGPTNGRYFFTCAAGSGGNNRSTQGKSRGCDLFMWAPALQADRSALQGTASRKQAAVVLPL